MPANDGATDPDMIIAQLKRENECLKIQLLTVTRDMAQMLAYIADGHLKDNGWGNA